MSTSSSIIEKLSKVGIFLIKNPPRFLTQNCALNDSHFKYLGLTSKTSLAEVIFSRARFQAFNLTLTQPRMFICKFSGLFRTAALVTPSSREHSRKRVKNEDT